MLFGYTVLLWLGVLSDPKLDQPIRSRQQATVTLASFKNTYTLVHFWATWCLPCVKELPYVEFLSQRLKTKPVQILAVSVDDDWKTIDRFFLEIKLTPSFMVLLDKDKVWAESFGTHKFPETYLLSKSGKVLRKWIGTVDWSDAKIWREIDEMISKN